MPFQFATEKKYQAEYDVNDDGITYEPVPNIDEEPDKYQTLKWSLQVKYLLFVLNIFPNVNEFQK